MAKKFRDNKMSEAFATHITMSQFLKYRFPANDKIDI